MNCALSRNVRGVDVEADGALARTHNEGASTRCVEAEDEASVTLWPTERRKGCVSMYAGPYGPN